MKAVVNFAKENSNKYGSKNSEKDIAKKGMKGGSNGFKNKGAITNLHKYQGK